MSREQRAGYEAQHETANQGAEAAEAEEASDLPPSILWRAKVLGPGDGEALKTLLRQYPELTIEIARAARQMGRSAIVRVVNEVQKELQASSTGTARRVRSEDFVEGSGANAMAPPSPARQEASGSGADVRPASGSDAVASPSLAEQLQELPEPQTSDHANIGAARRVRSEDFVEGSGAQPMAPPSWVREGQTSGPGADIRPASGPDAVASPSSAGQEGDAVVEVAGPVRQWHATRNLPDVGPARRVRSKDFIEGSGQHPMDPPSWARGEDAAPVHAAPDHAAPSHQAGDHDADAEASAPSTSAINGPGHGRVKALGLNVRSSPHAGSRDNILGTLRRGDQIEIIGRDGVWLQITYHGQPAYVHSGYVEREVAAPAAASGLEPGGPSQRQDGNPASIGPTQDVTSPPASISDAQSGDDALPPRELVSPYDYPGMSEILATDESRVTVAPVETGDKAGGGKGKKAETETGIATGIALDRFITAAHDVQTNWASLDKNTRGQKLGDAANTELDAVGVPKVGIVNKDLGEINGQLDFTPWNLDLNGTRFESPTTTSERMAPIARTVYHESRHAEQWFRMARIEAGQGKNAAAIASKLEIKPEVAAAAESKPLTGDSQEAKEAAAWHKSVYGADREARNTTLTNVSIHAKRMGDASAKSDAAEREYDRLRADTTASADDKKSALAAWKAAFAAYNAAKMTFNASYAAYTALPEEADAWKLGDRVMTAYKSK